MRPGGGKVDRGAGKRRESGTMSRAGYRFIDGEDASKLSLVLMRLDAGNAPTRKELDELRFSSPVARGAAAALVKKAGSSATPDRPHGRKVAGGSR